MATSIFKHTDEALAFITLYNAMRPEVKKEVKAMILKEIDNQQKSTFTSLSLQSWDLEPDGLEQSNLWEKFYNKQKNV